MPISHPERLLWSLTACYVLSAVIAALARPVRLAWTTAETLALLGLGIAMGTALVAAPASDAVHPAKDMVGITMAALVSLLGWVIVRYSRHYLAGEENQRRYLVSLMLVLGSVSTVVFSHNLALILIAWAASSLALHQLLLFYPRRTGALLAAHKKFIVSRLAEIFMAGALAYMYLATHSFSLHTLDAAAAMSGATGSMLQTAMLLIAIAVVLKAAQLPFHGWLMQVMEAPTPVSALLHAGVVNIGGFILIRLAPLLAAANAARALLVISGTLTATLAGLAMMTRVDIKTRLAWSTCAQMGFMLLECGLGLYALALLHLVAHSLYKAYEFLASGDTLRRTVRAKLSPRMGSSASHRRRVLPAKLLSAPIGLGATFLTAHIAASAVPLIHCPAIALLIVGLACAPLFWQGAHGAAVLQTTAIVLLYLGTHALFQGLAGGAPTAPDPALTWFVGVGFALMYLIQACVLTRPDNRLVQRLHAWAYAGFYLDELFNRVTQRIWPLSKTVQSTAKRSWAAGNLAAGDYECR